MNGICYLIGAGEETPLDFLPGDGDLIIAVDGGLDYLNAAGIKPSLIVGDFDSVSVRPVSGEIIRLCPEKDETDGYAAADEGLRRGYKVFRLYCMLGGRLSHTLANINLLAYIFERGGRAEIIGQGIRIMHTRTETDLPDCKYLSVLPLTETAEIEITGCKYGGKILLRRNGSLGISNEPNQNASLKVLSGEVIIVCEE